MIEELQQIRNKIVLNLLQNMLRLMAIKYGLC